MIPTCKKRPRAVAWRSSVWRFGLFSAITLALFVILFPTLLLADETTMPQDLSEVSEPSANVPSLPQVIDRALKESYESHSLSRALKLALLKDKNADKLFKPSLTLSGKLIDLSLSGDAELKDPSVDLKATQSLLVPRIGGQLFATVAVNNTTQNPLFNNDALGAPSSDKSFNSTVTLGYTRPILGANLDLLSAELSEELALLRAKKSYRDGVGNIVSSTASYLFEMAESRNRMVAALFDLVIAEKDLAVKKQRLDAGLIAPSEVTTADNALMSAEEEFINQRDAYLAACEKLRRAIGLEEDAVNHPGDDPLADAELILDKVETLRRQLNDILFGSGVGGDFIDPIDSAIADIMVLDYHRWPELDDYYAGLELSVDDPSVSPVTRDLNRIGEITTRLAEIDLKMAKRSYGWNLNLSTDYSSVTEELSATISFSKSLMNPKRDEEFEEKRISLENAEHNAKVTLRGAIEAYEGLIKGVKKSESLTRISAKQREYAIELVDTAFRKYKSGLATEFDIIKQVAHKVKTDTNYSDLMADVALAKLKAIIMGSDIIDNLFAGVVGDL